MKCHVKLPLNFKEKLSGNMIPRWKERKKKKGGGGEREREKHNVQENKRKKGRRKVRGRGMTAVKHSKHGRTHADS